MGDVTPGDASETARVLKAFDSLPTLPIVALRIGEVVNGKNASVRQVADILRTDPATSAKLLQLVNSPYFGVPGGISDVARAIPFVGFNTLYQLVLSIAVLDTLGTKDGFDVRCLWIHSLTVATAARELAAEVKFADTGGCFTAGLLHDIGMIALAKVDPERLARTLQALRDEGLTIEEAERKYGLLHHDNLGSRLARQWKFPATLATPIEHHHNLNKPEIRDRIPANLRTITEIVAAADHLSRVCAAATFGGEALAEDGDAVANELFERNGLGAEQQAALCERTKAQLERSKVFLSLLEA
jgi:putative nucleotidyltransferase with HDIG domain